jgi:CheY-specific phosphatase CheX
MSKKIETALCKAAALTFEELGFFFPETKLDEVQQNAPVQASVSVDFKGPVTGKLVVRLCGDLLPTLAANMLGETQAPSGKLQGDALGEIANVICGNALPAIAGPSAVFNLGAPRLLKPADTAGAEALPSPIAAASFGLEAGRADVLLYMDEKKKPRRKKRS